MEMISYFFILMGHHGQENTFHDMWEPLLTRISQKSHLHILIPLAQIWTGLRKGSRITGN